MNCKLAAGVMQKLTPVLGDVINPASFPGESTPDTMCFLLRFNIKWDHLKTELGNIL